MPDATNVIPLFNPPEVLDEAWANLQAAQQLCTDAHAEKGFESWEWNEAVRLCLEAGEIWLAAWRRDVRTYSRAPK